MLPGNDYGFDLGDLIFSIENPKKNITYRPYQMDALAAIEKSRQRKEKRALVVAPTGSGKTVIMGGIEQKGRMLILAHRDTLCQQAFSSMAFMHPHLKIGLEKAKSSCSPDDNIVIGSVQTLGGRYKDERDGQYYSTGRLLRFQPDDFDVVVVDECHHAVGNSYLRILQHLKAGTPEGPYLLGVTATPDRGDAKSLNDLFLGNLIFSKTIQDLQWEGYLCATKARRIYTDVDISDLSAGGEDFTVKELGEKVNIDFRNSQIISGVEDFASDRKCILVFAVDIDHAEKLSRDFAKRGHDVDFIHYKRDKTEQAEILQRFADGKLRILVNVAILTEGFDNPRIDCLVMARPTRSPLLLAQCIGRGTRQACPVCFSTNFEIKNINNEQQWTCGKCDHKWNKSEAKDALILDFVDVVGTLPVQNVNDLFGIPDCDLLNEPIHEAAPVIQEALELGVNIDPEDNIEQIRERVNVLDQLVRGTVYVETLAEAIDVFNATARDEEQFASRFPWLQLGNDKFLIYNISKDDPSPRIGVWRDTFGLWWIAKGQEKIQIGERDAIPWGKIDKQVRSFLKRKIPVSNDYAVPEWRFISLDAKWRRAKPKPGQIAELKRLGIKEIPPDASRGEVSDKIQWFKAHKKRLGV